MSRTTQDCVDTVAFLAQQVVSTQPSIVFHVPDYGLYRRPPLEPTPQRWLHLSHSLPSEMHFGSAFIVMATVASVYKNGLRCKVAQLLSLFYSIIKGMSVIRVAVKRLAPTTKLSLEVVVILTLQPNSYRLCTLPFAMHSTSGACTVCCCPFVSAGVADDPSPTKAQTVFPTLCCQIPCAQYHASRGPGTFSVS